MSIHGVFSFSHLASCIPTIRIFGALWAAGSDTNMNLMTDIDIDDKNRYIGGLLLKNCSGVDRCCLYFMQIPFSVQEASGSRR